MDVSNNRDDTLSSELISVRSAGMLSTRVRVASCDFLDSFTKEATEARSAAEEGDDVMRRCSGCGTIAKESARVLPSPLEAPVITTR